MTNRMVNVFCKCRAKRLSESNRIYKNLHSSVCPYRTREEISGEREALQDKVETRLVPIPETLERFQGNGHSSS